MKHYILDAYNIIHKSQFLRTKLSVTAEIAIASLIEAVKAYLTKYASYKATIIIDGTSKFVFESTGKLKIILSNSKTADELIKELVKSKEGDKSAVVVSSDREVANFAKAYAVSSISSEDFIRLLGLDSSATKPQSKSASAKPEKPYISKKDYNEFLNAFTKPE